MYCVFRFKILIIRDMISLLRMCARILFGYFQMFLSEISGYKERWSLKMPQEAVRWGGNAGFAGIERLYHPFGIIRISMNLSGDIPL